MAQQNNPNIGGQGSNRYSASPAITEAEKAAAASVVANNPNARERAQEIAAAEAAAAKAELQKSGDFDKATTGTPILYKNGKAGTETDLQRFNEGKGYAVYDSFTDADGAQYVAVSGKNSSFIEKINTDGTIERIDNVSRKRGNKNTNVNRVLGAFDSLKKSLDVDDDSLSLIHI